MPSRYNSESSVPLDDVDRQILERLHEDARTASSQIAQFLRVSDRTVRNRIEKLVARGLIRIGLLLDPETAGFPIVALVFIEVETGHLDEAVQHIIAHDMISYVASAAGDFDIVAQVYSPTNDQLFDLVQYVIARFPGVRRTNTTILPRVYKRPADWFPSSLRPRATPIGDTRTSSDGN